ncbi:transposase [Roseococcus sp.]|uniref:transposase n=1 Tax=Roseococcus sp. TaxID=2109646 RepID=UPI003BAD9D85
MRLAHAALWERLLIGLSLAPKQHPLRRLEELICRAIRLRGLRLIVLIRRLNLKRALPGPPWMCPDPDLSEKVFALPLPQRNPRPHRLRKAAIEYLRTIRGLLALAAGRRSIPRALKPSWP